MIKELKHVTGWRKSYAKSRNGSPDEFLILKFTLEWMPVGQSEFFIKIRGRHAAAAAVFLKCRAFYNGDSRQLALQNYGEWDREEHLGDSFKWQFYEMCVKVFFFF